MSDNTPETAAAHPPKMADSPDIDGQVVPPNELPTASEHEPVYDLVEVAPTATSGSEPVVARAHPAAAETSVVVQAPTAEEPPPRAATSAASMQTVYVPAPVPPLKKGNRGFGVLIALLSSLVFAGFYALVIAAIQAVEIGVFRFDFFGSLDFYTPIAFFFVGFVIVVLLANRASWWSFVVGSLFVALFVYFASVGAGLLANNVFGLTPTNAARLFSAALLNPFVIAAAIIARETSMWMGALISARGRKVKARNIEARETFDRESAARTAEYENSRYGVQDATV